MHRVKAWTATLLAVAFVSSTAAADGPATYGARIDAGLASASREIGNDPAKALAWVAHAASYEAYRGSLRGARGAWVTGRANSIDQALLLKAVLKPAESRFASCTLSDADAASLADGPAPQAAALLIENAETLATQASDAKLKAYLGKLGAAWTALKTIQTGESAALADAVSAAGIVFAGPDAATARHEAAAAHVWLEVKAGDQWIDLDPTIPGATPGATRCKPAQTFEAIPADLTHRVSIAVVAEIKTSTDLLRKELLRYDGDAAALNYDDVLFYFAEAQGRKTDADAAARKSAAFAYTPELRVGDAETEGKPFLARAPKSGIGGTGAAANKAVGGAIDALGGLGDPEPSPSAPVAASDLPEEPVAAFIEITLTSPGEPAVTVSTPIFDRAGAASRAAKDKAPRLKDLAETDADYAALARVWTIGVMSGAAAHRLEQPAKAMADGDVFVQALALAGAARGFDAVEAALLRTASLAPVATHRRPRLLLLAFGPDGLGKDARIAVEADLAASGAEDAPDASETIAQRAARAVARVLAERIVTGAGGLPPLVASTALAPAEPTDLVALATAGKAQGLSWQSGTAGLGDADAKALADARVTDGATVLSPSGPVTLAGAPALGWWVAEARTGQLYDEMADGRSAEAVEYNETGEPARQSIPAWRQHACTLRRAILGVTAVLAIGLASPELAAAADAAREQEEAIQLAEERVREAAQREGGSGAGC